MRQNIHEHTKHIKNKLQNWIFSYSKGFVLVFGCIFMDVSDLMEFILMNSQNILVNASIISKIDVSNGLAEVAYENKYSRSQVQIFQYS